MIWSQEDTWRPPTLPDGFLPIFQLHNPHNPAFFRHGIRDDVQADAAFCNYMQYGAAVSLEAARLNRQFNWVVDQLDFRGEFLYFPLNHSSVVASWTNTKRLFQAIFSAFMDHNVPTPEMPLLSMPIGPRELVPQGQRQVEDWILGREEPIFEVARRAYLRRGPVPHPDAVDGELDETGYDQFGLLFPYGQIQRSQDVQDPFQGVVRSQRSSSDRGAPSQRGRGYSGVHKGPKAPARRGRPSQAKRLQAAAQKAAAIAGDAASAPKDKPVTPPGFPSGNGTPAVTGSAPNGAAPSGAAPSGAADAGLNMVMLRHEAKVSQRFDQLQQDLPGMIREAVRADAASKRAERDF